MVFFKRREMTLVRKNTAESEKEKRDNTTFDPCRELPILGDGGVLVVE